MNEIKTEMKNCPYQCPVEAAFDFMGGKWKALIIWYIGPETKRYHEIKKALPKVSSRVLSNQLKQLEEDRLIIKHRYIDIQERVEYNLTDAGLSLLPILNMLCDWSITNYPEFIPENFKKMDPGERY